MERFAFIGTAHIFLFRAGSILLARRRNTGFMDGMYSVPAGHLDGDETVREGAAREALEEVGMRVKPHDVEVVHVMHRKCGEKVERLDFFVTIRAFDGDVENAEPDKCDDLSWFSLDALPENTIPYIRQAITAVQKGDFYSEFGWDSRV